MKSVAQLICSPSIRSEARQHTTHNSSRAVQHQGTITSALVRHICSRAAHLLQAGIMDHHICSRVAQRLVPTTAAAQSTTVVADVPHILLPPECLLPMGACRCTYQRADRTRGKSVAALPAERCEPPECPLHTPCVKVSYIEKETEREQFAAEVNHTWRLHTYSISHSQRVLPTVKGVFVETNTSCYKGQAQACHVKECTAPS